MIVFYAIVVFNVCCIAYLIIAKVKRDRELNSRSTSTVKAIAEPESFGPKKFLNSVKRSLPKNLGFIYEVSTGIVEKSDRGYGYGNIMGDFLVKVGIIDPLTGNTLDELEFNERLDSKYRYIDLPEEKITTAIKEIMRKREIEGLKNYKEIVT